MRWSAQIWSVPTTYPHALHKRGIPTFTSRAEWAPVWPHTFLRVSVGENWCLQNSVWKRMVINFPIYSYIYNLLVVKYRISIYFRNGWSSPSPGSWRLDSLQECNCCFSRPSRGSAQFFLAGYFSMFDAWNFWMLLDVLIHFLSEKKRPNLGWQHSDIYWRDYPKIAS